MNLNKLLKSYDQNKRTNFIDERRLPEVIVINQVMENLMEILFPGCSGKREITRENLQYVIGDLLSQVRCDLREQILLAYKHECNLTDCLEESCIGKAERATNMLIESLADIRTLLKKDVEAAFAGDPAATSEEEIVISYPGLKAVSIHRMAHILYVHKVPLIPRLMSEISHSHTGIDIHPGARIEEGFFIDHGTGVVIGETTIIGKNVKIYQGVTLGALSFPKNACGELIRDQKRHPTIENNVTIYAHATILGNVTIGANSLIGSNVWLKEDIPANTRVLAETPKMTFRSVGKIPTA
ncbi:MAG: serine acetyltransferase [Spirochaetia bacterium]|nr:serine acetyltransferase [Spirochaetia bacterium]